MGEPFFVLGRDHDGGAHSGWLRGVAVALVLVSFASAALLVGLQRTVADDARFEYGTVRAFEGTLIGDPVALLVTGEQVHFLVNPLKFGLADSLVERWTGQRVGLRATLIERGGRTMLEVVEGSVRETGGSAQALRPGPAMPVELSGRIVDSKCYLGVMNPGFLKPHRACAMNCIRGGIPPVLLAADGRQVVLVSGDGDRLQDWILPFVAEPVTVQGELAKVGPLEVLSVVSSGVRRGP